MTWSSEAQREWGNSPQGVSTLGRQEVEKRNEASKGQELPARLHPPSEDRELVKNVNRKMNR